MKMNEIQHVIFLYDCQHQVPDFQGGPPKGAQAAETIVQCRSIATVCVNYTRWRCQVLIVSCVGQQAYYWFVG